MKQNTVEWEVSESRSESCLLGRSDSFLVNRTQPELLQCFHANPSIAMDTIRTDVVLERHGNVVNMVNMVNMVNLETPG